MARRRRVGLLLAISIALTISMASAGRAQDVRFNYPRVNGSIADHCARWATDCGWGGANLFCRSRGYAKATNWSRYRPGRTWVIGSRRRCVGNFCTGFRHVTCRRRVANRGFWARWDKISGPGGGWSTGWVRQPRASQCGHYARGCRCGRYNYCGRYNNRQTKYWWPRGCRGPLWRIRCTVRPAR